MDRSNHSPLGSSLTSIVSEPNLLNTSRQPSSTPFISSVASSSLASSSSNSSGSSSSSTFQAQSKYPGGAANSFAKCYSSGYTRSLLPQPTGQVSQLSNPQTDYDDGDLNSSDDLVKDPNPPSQATPPSPILGRGPPPLYYPTSPPSLLQAGPPPNPQGYSSSSYPFMLVPPPKDFSNSISSSRAGPPPGYQPLGRLRSHSNDSDDDSNSLGQQSNSSPPSSTRAGPPPSSQPLRRARSPFNRLSSDHVTSSSSSSSAEPTIATTEPVKSRTTWAAAGVVGTMVFFNIGYARYQLNQQHESNIFTQKNIQSLVALVESQIKASPLATKTLFSKENILPLLLIAAPGIAALGCALIALRTLNKMARQKMITEQAEQKISQSVRKS